MAGDSGYKGINLLSSDTETAGNGLKSILMNEESSLYSLGFDASATVGLKIADPGANGWANTSDIRDSVDELTTARETLRTKSATLSNNLSIITARQEFTQGMINVLKDGAAELTNADMNEEGAIMLVLQTRQALGTTSLSLASQAASRS